MAVKSLPFQLRANSFDLAELDSIHISLDAPGQFVKYTAKEHALKVAKHLGVQKGLIYLLGTQSASAEDSDRELPFRQRRYFYYLSGVDFPDCSLTYDIETTKLTLYIPAPEPSKIIWLGPTPSIQECLDKYEVDQVSYTCELRNHIFKWAASNSHQKIFLLHPTHAPPSLASITTNLDATALQPAMDEARVIKSAYEISLLRRANAISSSAHRHVLASLHSATNETHLEAVFLQTCIAKHAKKQAYAPIVGSGENASTLHYEANNEDLAGRELVCLDASCEWECYAADITRTFPISGTFSPEAAAIYEIVTEMQTRCIEALEPGVIFRDLHDLAMESGIRGLLRLGILKNGTYEEIREAGTGRLFFPHGLGHHLGLETHDVDGAHPLLVATTPCTASLSVPPPPPPPYTHRRKLEAGMVVTVEPGIYISRYAVSVFGADPKHAKFLDFGVIERYYKVGGVRIEDDLLVTEGGCENLTTAPKGEEMCAIIRRGRGEGECDGNEGVY
ncbi:hypothetical protein VE01_02178 [Pseudogymnoascus verrucosus]|uniref:Xaa-Pro aminopeptidase n=1 Tax=Pseudogymnoascus verrucosus TaxID=342668 RepID=A0A1B8GVG7_9PEZI|nr:uncharacterized protein VE01_02178 [Pseudogymnoascus verrucosus]OBT99823.1 hypothetical protein VE01_02178 [Pseudogymnoascus verrucosus]